MKYLRYLGIVLFTGFRKVFGLAWYLVVVPFRFYANNVVFNYTLDNGVYLKRLLEKSITETDEYFTIQPSHGTIGGKIKRRDVSKAEYYLVYWIIWGWLDADSFCDTSSERFMKEWQDGTRGTRDNSKKLAKCKGSAFDRGDDVEKNWCGLMAILWNVRNTGVNFKYSQWECREPKQLFYFKLGEWQFGYHTKESDPKHIGRLIFGRD